MKIKPFPPPIGKYLVPPIIKLWIKNIRGLENLPKDKAFILAPNHCSYIEHFMIGSIVVPYLNKKLYFIAKKEHFESITQSTWHSLWKRYITYIPIDREKGEGAIKAAVSYLRRGAIIVT
ncbi:1-acyl-sn-glycerol-3-phosphate acyltransferase [Candidatus Woesearchaeota archaeon]|nr:1-acyl-sn-glycerol-3-phosphate acyltransferase [Candidatus Woesearchaeota archaeon]